SCCSVMFIILGPAMARFMSDDPEIARLTATALFITAFCQPGLAAAIIFSGALRGAGDTLVSMMLNLATVFGLRLAGVVFVVYVLHGGLAAIWIVLASELMVRGTVLYGRFVHEGWAKVKV